MKFSSLAALEVVILTTSSAASDDNFIEMKTCPFQCRSPRIQGRFVTYMCSPGIQADKFIYIGQKQSDKFVYSLLYGSTEASLGMCKTVDITPN